MYTYIYIYIYAYICTYIFTYKHLHLRYVHLSVRHVPLSRYSNTPLRIVRHMANFETATFRRSLFGFLTICDNFWPQETKMRVQHEQEKARSTRAWEATKPKATLENETENQAIERTVELNEESGRGRSRECERERGVAHSCTHYATNLFGLGLGQNLNISAPTTKTTSTDFSRFGLVLLDCSNERTNGSSSIDRCPNLRFCLHICCLFCCFFFFFFFRCCFITNKYKCWLEIVFNLVLNWHPPLPLLHSLAHSWQTHSPFINFYCLIELTWAGLGFNEGSFFWAYRGDRTGQKRQQLRSLWTGSPSTLSSCLGAPPRCPFSLPHPADCSSCARIDFWPVSIFIGFIYSQSRFWYLHWIRD